MAIDMDSYERHKKLLGPLKKWVSTPQNGRRAEWSKSLQEALNDRPN